MSKMKSIREIEMERATQPNFGKGITVASGFDLGAKAPLDSRLTVKTIEERNAHVTGNRAYEGMLVYVEADKKTYQLIDGAWEEFGFNEEKFQQGVQPIVDKNAEQDERLEVLENLVVGGEGEGLGAVIEDVAKNKADINVLKTDLAKEISDREAADADLKDELRTHFRNTLDGELDILTRVMDAQDAALESKFTNDFTELVVGFSQALEEMEQAYTDADNLINEELDTKADQANLQAEINRATGVEQGLNTRLNTVEGKVTNNEAAIQVNAKSISDEVAARKSEIARVEGLVATEKERAEGVEANLQANIDKKVSKEEFNAEKTRVNNALAGKVSNEAFAEEQERVEGLIEQVSTTLEGHGTLIEGVNALALENKEKKADKVQVANDILVGVGQAKSYADEKLVDAKSYADGKLVDAKAYTDEEIVKVSSTITNLDAAYKEADTKVLADAKTYADKAVADLVDNAPETLNTLKELADALTNHENEYDSLLEVVGGKANSADVYTKTEVDGIKTNLQTSITKVETDYKAADVALDGRLKTVEGIAGGVGAIRSELDKAKQDIVTNTTEIAGCKTSITTNASAITKEVSDRKQADNALDTKITTEKERALAAESKLEGQITNVGQEVEATKEDVVANTNAIAQEVTNRQSAINTLDTKINNTLPVTSSVQPTNRAEGHVWIEILG